ncbi:hypothetical protein BJ742DRAFT_761321 [Cladochytrium replicatum]|nr:hypothetical protein BJ742DRAFT_761321 [Cladochytrium replicatum]
MPEKKIQQTLVNSKSIRLASLHISTPREWHAYAYPFGAVYGIWAYIYLVKYEDLLGSAEVSRLGFILVLSFHALTYLVCQWSVDIKTALTCKNATDPYTATSIKIVPELHHGKSEICDIKRAPGPSRDSKKPQLYFYFQKKKYIYSEERKAFVKLDFPSSQKLPMGHFANFKGFMSDTEVAAAKQKYGPNAFDIPLPSFQELMQEHLVAPFFVFQLFCVALWFLDDMWYYSLFTLVMLFVFESTVVFQRLTNLKEFRQMSTKPYPVQVKRNGRWVEVQTDELMPGDMVSILRSKDDAPVPCDVLILRGDCIANEAMLSGESTPQLKESIENRPPEDVLDIDADKGHILFGGTKVIQVSAPKEGAPPDGGCIGYVMRTGFSTQQGKLVRTMVYSSDRVSANNTEALFFILFLLVFALIAAAYVWNEGMKNEDRKKSKVLLDCILIVTSVVPPELPMELSLAVNNSLVQLAKKYIFCTEPFRIPFGGRIDVACFDKTGTLTVEDLKLEGLAGLTNEVSELINPKSVQLPRATIHVMVSAHALALLDEGVIGDPMEKNTVEAVDWAIVKGNGLMSKKQLLAQHGRAQLKPAIKILRRYAFSSALKRMSSVSLLYVDSQGNEINEPKTLVSAKGAPETLATMFESLPKNYDATYKYWARKGSRVLALGYKFMDSITPEQVKDLPREAVEKDLIFAGFLIFTCPLKPDAKAAIEALNNSAHRSIMITGDNPLTACHVAEEVQITKRTVLIGDAREDGDELRFTWRSLDDETVINLTKDDLKKTTLDKRVDSFDLCLTGKGLSVLADSQYLTVHLPRVWVYARVSPSQKEYILTAFKNAGFTTLMCGDGTNDVGALKRADVGIALLNAKEEDMEKINQRMREQRVKQVKEQQEALRQRLGLPPLEEPQRLAPGGASGSQVARNGAKPAVNNKVAEKVKSMEKYYSDQLSDMLGEDMEPPKIKFGDASVASPFTSKLASVTSVTNVVKQGRATLVAMTQMYKILALNCLISAYYLSVLNLAGIRQGDWQATVAGMMLTVCFFGISKSNPPEVLSKKRPQPNIFNFYIVLSVLGQVALHIACLIYIRQESLKWMDELEEELNVDSEFKPNLLNSGVYLVSLVMQISTFAINYQGAPFRESIFQNKPLYNSLLVVTGIAFAAAFEVSEDLNEWMQLVPFPEEYRRRLVVTLFIDFGGSWVVEMVTLYLFSNNKPKKSLMVE